MAKIYEYLKTAFFVLLILQILPSFFRNIVSQYNKVLEPHTKVAIVDFSGELQESLLYTKQLRKYFQDRDIKAILLTMDCPGGAAGTADAIANEIALLKKEYPKPIVTLVENLCASGAYLIAANTDWIIAPPSALVGSIGVLIPHQFKLHDFITKYDIHYNEIKSGEFKNATDPFVNTTPEKNAMLQAMADSCYKNFTENIAKNRPKLTLATRSAWAEGKVFAARDVQGAMVDELGSHYNAERKLKQLALIEGDIEWVKKTQHAGLWNIFAPTTDESEAHAQQSVFTVYLEHACNFLEHRYGNVLHGRVNGPIL